MPATPLTDEKADKNGQKKNKKDENKALSH